MNDDRVTLRIPHEYMVKISALLRENGYTSINDYLLDNLRHFDAITRNNGATLRHFDAAKPIKTVAEAKKVVSKSSNLCKHNFAKGLCKYGCT